MNGTPRPGLYMSPMCAPPCSLPLLAEWGVVAQGGLGASVSLCPSVTVEENYLVDQGYLSWTVT